jgi:Flp pilus assembly protein TadG
MCAKLRPRCSSPCCRATVAVELLFVLPLLLLLIMAAVEVGMLLSVQQQLQLASREGARVAALGGDEADVASAVRLVLGRGALTGATIFAELTDNNGNPLPSGAPVVVVVSIATQAVVPNLVGWSGAALAGQTISAQTVMRKE